MSKEKTRRVDADIAILNAITPEGFKWSARDIGEILGVSSNTIDTTINKALKKLRRNQVLKQHFEDLQGL